MVVALLPVVVVVVVGSRVSALLLVGITPLLSRGSAFRHCVLVGFPPLIAGGSGGIPPLSRVGGVGVGGVGEVGGLLARSAAGSAAAVRPVGVVGGEVGVRSPVRLPAVLSKALVVAATFVPSRLL